MSNLWEKDNYKSPINFIIGNQIREYDMSKANISVLRDAEAISEEQYQYFLHCPKLEREITIGKMRGSNPKLTDILKEGIKQARRKFIDLNNIDDIDILAIRNDALTIIGRKPIKALDITERVSFRLDGLYSSFYHINNLDLLYMYDPIGNTENLDIKGMNDEAINLHKDYMLDLLSEIFFEAQTTNVTTSIETLQSVHSRYILREMPIGFYRELNSGSRFRLNSEFSMYSTLYLEHATEYDKRHIDISYNEKVLRILNQYYSSIYFGKI